MPGEVRAPRRPYEARVAQHADRAFAGGLGGQQIPRPIQNLDQNRRQVPKDPPGFEWVFAPNTFDWTISRTNFAVAAGDGAGCTISTADSYGALPSWGSQFDSTFLYTARAGMFQLYTQLTLEGGGTCPVLWFTGWSEHEMTLQPGETYDAITALPLQADQNVGGLWDFISTPTVLNRDSGSRNFSLAMYVEAIFLV